MGANGSENLKMVPQVLTYEIVFRLWKFNALNPILK